MLARFSDSRPSQSIWLVSAMAPAQWLEADPGRSRTEAFGAFRWVARLRFGSAPHRPSRFCLCTSRWRGLLASRCLSWLYSACQRCRLDLRCPPAKKEPLWRTSGSSYDIVSPPCPDLTSKSTVCRNSNPARLPLPGPLSGCWRLWHYYVTKLPTVCRDMW